MRREDSNRATRELRGKTEICLITYANIGNKTKRCLNVLTTKNAKGSTLSLLFRGYHLDNEQSDFYRYSLTKATNISSASRLNLLINLIV